MNYRALGSSELQVSEISLGSWLTYAGGVGLEQTRACTDIGRVGVHLRDLPATKEAPDRRTHATGGAV
jgi:hypothetical protein